MFNKTVPAILMLLLSSTMYANEYLTADEIRVLFTDKSFDIHNVVKDKHLQGYDNAGGQHFVFIPWKDKISKRKWWIEEDKHCTSHPKRGDSCKLVKHVGDGVYHGISDGEHTHTLSNFREGRIFNK